MIRKKSLALGLCTCCFLLFFMGTLRAEASANLEDASTSVSDPASSVQTEGPGAYQINTMPDVTIDDGSVIDSTQPILKDVRTAEQGNQTLLIKTWNAPPDYDANWLIESDFEKGGISYKKAYLLQVSENHRDQSKLASETVTIAHENRNDALAKLQPIMDYDKDGFRGQLTLQADAIVTEAAGKSSYSYKLTDTREYTGLERNDPYNIPKTLEKDGSQLQLTDVDWTKLGEGNYKAVATYRGMATGSTVTGYLSTATYIGEVKKEVLDSVTYAVVYEGNLIPPPPIDFSPYLIMGGCALIVLAATLIWISKRNNTKVYAMIGKEYQLVHKQRLTSLAPIIDLFPQDISGQSEEFMIILNRLALRRLRGHNIKIIGKDGMMKEQRIYKIRHFQIGKHQEEDYE